VVCGEGTGSLLLLSLMDELEREGPIENTRRAGEHERDDGSAGMRLNLNSCPIGT
jgi:hypothetical protein